MFTIKNDIWYHSTALQGQDWRHLIYPSYNIESALQKPSLADSCKTSSQNPLETESLQPISWTTSSGAVPLSLLERSPNAYLNSTPWRWPHCFLSRLQSWRKFTPFLLSSYFDIFAGPIMFLLVRFPQTAPACPILPCCPQDGYILSGSIYELSNSVKTFLSWINQEGSSHVLLQLSYI